MEIKGIEEVIFGDRTHYLHLGPARELIQAIPDEAVDLIHYDPPWSYRTGKVRGSAQKEYSGLTFGDIADTVSSGYRVAKEDSYMFVWCTFPHIMRWGSEHESKKSSSYLGDWEHLSGGGWGKRGRGVGTHFTGDCEVFLCYRKGRPRPVNGPESNLYLTSDDPDSIFFLTNRTNHSEKPISALISFIKMNVPKGGIVLDPYAGESGSMGQACRFTGTRYLGAEIDPERHKKATDAIDQGVLF